MTTIRRWNPPGMPTPASNFSHAVLASEATDWLYLAGQVGIGLDGKVAEGLSAQIAQCLLQHSFRAANDATVSGHNPCAIRVRERRKQCLRVGPQSVEYRLSVTHCAAAHRVVNEQSNRDWCMTKSRQSGHWARCRNSNRENGEDA